jgi:cell division protein FtsL
VSRSSSARTRRDPIREPNGTSARGPARGRRRWPGAARLRLVVPRSRSRLPFFIAAFLLVGVTVLGVVALQAVVSQNSFRLERLSQRNANLQDTVGRLQLQVAQLSAPARIMGEARRLGLLLPDQTETVTVDLPRSAWAGAPDGLMLSPETGVIPDTGPIAEGPGAAGGRSNGAP